MILRPLYTAYKETLSKNAIHYYYSIKSSTSVIYTTPKMHIKSYIFERIYIIPLIDLSFYTSDITLYMLLLHMCIQTYIFFLDFVLYEMKIV